MKKKKSRTNSRKTYTSENLEADEDRRLKLAAVLQQTQAPGKGSAKENPAREFSIPVQKSWEGSGSLELYPEGGPGKLFNSDEFPTLTRDRLQLKLIAHCFFTMSMKAVGAKPNQDSSIAFARKATKDGAVSMELLCIRLNGSLDCSRLLHL